MPPAGLGVRGAHLGVYGSYEAHMGLGAKEGGQCRQWGEDWEWRISGIIGCYQQIQDNPPPAKVG